MALQANLVAAPTLHHINHRVAIRNSNGALRRRTRSAVQITRELEVLNFPRGARIGSADERPWPWPGAPQRHRPGRIAASGRTAPVSHTRPSRILISTGDVMGDMHGAALVRALRAEAGEEIEVYAMGGKRMQEAGAVLIGINISLGKYAKKNFGCKVIYFIPPNEWLWNTSRTGAIIDSCDAILSVYPGETDYFRNSGGHVVEVGHPLLDRCSPTQTRTQAREDLGYNENDLVILLMPASRAQELRHVWPIIASAAKLLLTRILALKSHHHVHFIVPSVVPSGDHLIEQSFEEFGLTGYASLWQGDTLRPMRAADLAITKSGSVNLELALHNVPQVVVYKLDKATAWIARNVFQFDLKYISLVNLILEEQVVPEFIQDAAEPVKVAKAAFDLLPLSNSRHRSSSVLNGGYAKLLPLLGKPGVVKRTAQYILEALDSERQCQR